MGKGSQYRESWFIPRPTLRDRSNICLDLGYLASNLSNLFACPISKLPVGI